MAIPTADPTSGSGAEDSANRIAIILSGTDADGALDHFTIATLPANGHLFDASSGGTLLSANSTVPASGNQAIVYFQPDTDWNGSSSFDYTASQSGEDSAAATASITVTAVQDAFEDTATTAEDTAVDIDVLANDFFEGTEQITGVGTPTHGTATINTHGTASTADDTIIYTPNADYNGPDSFTYTVTSGTGTAETATVNVTVNAVNDAPILDLSADPGSNNFATTFTEDTPNFLGTGPVAISDLLGTAIIDDDNGRTKSATVTLTNAKAGDVLTVLASPVDGSFDFGSGEPISWHIDTSVAGKIIVTLTGLGPNGAPNTDFAAAIQSIDFNNTADNPDTTDRIVEAFVNDGITDGPTATTTIQVFSINDAPANTVPPTQTIDEDHDLVFSAANGNAITIADVDVELGNQTVTLSVSHGVLTLGAIPAGLVFGTGDGTADTTMTFTGTVSDVNTALDGLLYRPDAKFHGIGASADVLTITTNDNGNTGDDPDGPPPVPQSEEATSRVTIDVNSVNDAPEGADVLKTIQEDQPYTFTTADFGFNDPNDSPPDAFTSVTIAALAGAGTLTLNDVAVTAGQSISVTDINDGNLKFTPGANENGSNYAQIGFQVQDNGGTTNSGVDTDQSPNAITFDVTAANDPPAGTDITKTTFEDQAFTTFTAADFGFSDTSDNPANTFQSVVITTLPVGGVLTLGGNDVAAGDEIPVGQLGTLVFTPTTDLNGVGAGGFTFQVKDNGGALDGGVDTDPSAHTFTFNINSITDAFDDSTAAVEDHVTTLNVLANDTFSDPAAAITGVTNGEHGSVAIGANGNVIYTPDANFRGDDLFTYTVTAGGLTETANVHISMVLQAAPPPGTAPVDGDVQGDRFGDLFVYRDDGPSAIWQMRENLRLDSGTNLPDNGPTWHAKAFTDLDTTEGFSDIVWQNDNGDVAVWQMYSVNVIDQVNLPNLGAATHVRGAQDFDGNGGGTNGGGDILLQSDDGTLTLWMMQDATHIGSAVTIDQNPGAPWKAALVGDFNGDGQAGILLTTANGDAALWEDYATTSPGHGRFDLQGNLPSNGPTWHARAVADFDGDNKDDILWQNDNGLAAVWLMDGLQIKDGFNITGTDANGPTWHIIAARDMNHDSRAGILFQNDIGQVTLWEDFTPTSGTTATFTTQLNIMPELNPTGQLFWHIL